MKEIETRFKKKNVSRCMKGLFLFFKRVRCCNPRLVREPRCRRLWRKTMAEFKVLQQAFGPGRLIVIHWSSRCGIRMLEHKESGARVWGRLHGYLPAKRKKRWRRRTSDVWTSALHAGTDVSPRCSSKTSVCVDDNGHFAAAFVSGPPRTSSLLLGDRVTFLNHGCDFAL